MSLSEDILSKIDDYLDGSLNDADLQFFEAQRISNPELNQLVELNKSMHQNYDEDELESLKNYNNKAIDALESYYKSEEGVSTKDLLNKAQEAYNAIKEPDSKRKSNHWLLGIAASIIIVIGWFVIGGVFSDKNYYETYNDWQDLPSLASKNDTNNALLIQGEAAFLNKKYDDAIGYFEAFIKKETTIHPNALIYLGISQLETGFNEDAINTFDQLIASKTIDASKGYWYKALVYLKLKNIGDAITQLEIITENPEYFKYTEARKLLTKIKG